MSPHITTRHQVVLLARSLVPPFINHDFLNPVRSKPLTLITGKSIKIDLPNVMYFPQMAQHQHHHSNLSFSAKAPSPLLHICSKGHDFQAIKVCLSNLTRPVLQNKHCLTKLQTPIFQLNYNFMKPFSPFSSIHHHVELET